MKKIIFFVAAVLPLLFLACQKQNQEPGTSMSDSTMKKDTSSIADDQDFLNEAAQGGMMEVELGKIAQRKAVSKDIKNFGEMMVTDHSKANDELKSLVQRNNLSIPDSLNGDNRDDVKKLSKLSGRKFDKEYVDMMVDDHKKDVDKFTDEAQNAKSSEVRQWASKTLPVLQKHLDRIQEIQKRMNK